MRKMHKQRETEIATVQRCPLFLLKMKFVHFVSSVIAKFGLKACCYN